MMQNNFKFHAIAILVICVLITVIYSLTAPPPAPPPQDPNTVGDRAIEVDSATWGLECNSFIKDIIEKRKEQPLPKEGEKKQEPLEKLELAVKNNVLIKVGELCNAKNTCELTATNEMLGIKIPSSCSAKLDIAYRCYSYDRLWNLSIKQGETHKIDCNEAATTTTK